MFAARRKKRSSTGSVPARRRRASARPRPAISAAAVGALAIVVIFAGSRAQAVPSFARQTGLECAACHVAFPELTQTGRLFKLKGYTMQGGDSPLPPLAVMTQPSFTHTDADQPGGAAPHFGPNDNFAVSQTSLFYAGAISSDLGIGAFAQATYDASARRFGWDNVDLRFARAGMIGDRNFVYGLTLNNNPTAQDVWNTIPAWRFPFASSNLAPTPAAAAVVDGGLGQQVAGLGGYLFWNDLVYLEATGYRTLSTRTLTTLGVDSTGVNSISGVAPYWRVALQPSWGKHTLEVGTFGLAGNFFPARATGNGTDRIVDVGFDTQYQYNGDRDQISLQASWIHEDARPSASLAFGAVGNAHNRLDSHNVKASYFYDHTYGVNLAYFSTSGTTDPVLFAPDPIGGSANGSPNSSGWVAELDYVPFMHGGPSFWPWFNVRFALQYTAYTKFNGGTSNYDGFGRNASDNNTLFLLAWTAF